MLQAKFSLALIPLVIFLAAGSATRAQGISGGDLFREHCVECHGPDRLGATGPALLPESLKRLRKKKAVGVISNGRTATQMPAFAETLKPEQIAALVDFIYSPLAAPPRWGVAEIRASRVVNATPDQLPAKPLFQADPMNLFVVVESGDHHVTILDGDRLEPITRFTSRFALHGGPKFTPDGRFVYFGSRDGWVTKYDIYNLKVVAEIRAGINTRNLALSHDGKVVAVANYLPSTLVMLDAADLSLLEVIPVTDKGRKNTSRVSAVYQAAPRQSFIAALKDVPEVWEIPYARAAQSTPFSVRRIDLNEPLDDFFFDQAYKKLMGSSRDGSRGVVVDLDEGRQIAELPLAGLPHLGSGITWTYRGKRVMATPHLKEGAVSVIDTDNWSLVKRIKTLGPGFFMRSHENSPYAWVDVFFGKNRDAVHVIDKKSLEIVKTLRPAPGKTAAHVEFTRDGRYALLSIWDMDGAIIVYDAATLEEVKRIPLVKPAGKYNIYNKVHRSEGTSH